MNKIFYDEPNIHVLAVKQRSNENGDREISKPIKQIIEIEFSLVHVQIYHIFI